MRPLVDEYHRLELAAAALAGVGARDGRSGSRRPAAVSGRSGRPRGSGSRAIQALELVRARPGISIREPAEAMQIQANYGPDPLP